jgi:CHRD domain-containing protein
VSLSLFVFNASAVNGIVNQDRYWSVLKGDKMKPPVSTDAVGYIGLKFPDDMSKMIYTVNARNIGNVTGIYFYLKGNQQNDTIVLDLLKAESKRKVDDIKITNVTSEGKLAGTISVGGAINNDLQGRLKGKSISDFHELMVKGKLYVSIHTKDYPNGEISGHSFVGMHRLFPDDSDIKWD